MVWLPIWLTSAGSETKDRKLARRRRTKRAAWESAKADPLPGKTCVDDRTTRLAAVESYKARLAVAGRLWATASGRSSPFAGALAETLNAASPTSTLS
jgi:hypothetical protein